MIKRTDFFKIWNNQDTDDKAVEEKNEDTGSLTYWASKILNTACPQQKVREEQCLIALYVVQVSCADNGGGGVVRVQNRSSWKIQTSNLLNSYCEIAHLANTIIHWTHVEKFSGSTHWVFLLIKKIQIVALFICEVPSRCT